MTGSLGEAEFTLDTDLTTETVMENGTLLTIENLFCIISHFSDTKMYFEQLEDRHAFRRILFQQLVDFVR
jgi:hypothetical protein